MRTQDCEVMEEWDLLLQHLIKNGEITAHRDYTITFDEKYVVWIGNHPYMSGYLYKVEGVDFSIDHLTKRIGCRTETSILLEDFVNNHLKEGMKNSPIVCAINDDIEKYKKLTNEVNSIS